MLEITSHIMIPDEELHFSFSRSGGPGGQNVNKVNSKATLHWKPNVSVAMPNDVRHRFMERFANRVTNEGDIVITSQLYRDQPKNIDDCLAKLRAMILEVLIPPKKRRPTKPSKGSQRRRLDEKKRNSQVKQGRKGGRED